MQAITEYVEMAVYEHIHSEAVRLSTNSDEIGSGVTSSGGHRWPDKAKIDVVHTIWRPFSIYLWHSREDRLSIGNRSVGNNVPSLSQRSNNEGTRKSEYASPSLCFVILINMSSLAGES